MSLAGKPFSFFVRDFNAADLIDDFLVSAASAVLATRMLLAMTKYPQLSGEGFHISHMLWGGLLLVAALFTSLIFLNKEAKKVSAIAGGLGFGIFIDELGKFITSDNNYFFQPTIAFIYLIFVLMFFIVRGLGKYLALSDRDYTTNALELLKEVILHDLDEEEKNRALSYLDKSNPKDPIVKLLKGVLGPLEASPVSEKSLLVKIGKVLHSSYHRFLKSRRLAELSVRLFVFVSLFGIVNAFILLSNVRNDLSFWNLGRVLSALVVGLIVLLGVYKQRKDNRLAAFEAYKGAVMISILVGQFFQFYASGALALSRLLVRIAMYSALQYLISEERAF